MTAPTVTEPAESAAGSSERRRARFGGLINAQARTWLLRGVLVVMSLFALLLLAAVVERVAYSGQVLPGVDVEGVEVEGLSSADAFARLDALGDSLEHDPILARADTTDLTANPSAVRLRVDREATLRDARRAGRSGNPFEAVGGFVLRRFRHEEIEVQVAFDRDAVDGVVDGWQGRVENRVQEGDLIFDGTDVDVVTPRAGTGIDRADARNQLVNLLGSTRRSRLTLRVAQIEPAVDLDDLQSLAARARRILRNDYVVRGARGSAAVVGPDEEPLDPIAEITVAAADLSPTLDARIVERRLVLRLDHERLGEILGNEDDVFTTAPIAARFSILPDGSVGIVASQNGKELDLRRVARQILAERAEIEAPLRVVRPDHDTAWARELGIKEVVSSFTTHHSCCAVRITNIHTAADYMNNTVIEPGQTFSLNDVVGPRTPERGFVSAPVFYGEFTEDFGGGVSQLATTTFNAAFWGGFEIVEHKPHSIYFDRYPMGREATVNYPKVDLVWRNDSDHGVLVQTSYTETSVTVTLFGDNEGRVVSEENEDGSCRVPESTDRISEQRCVTVLETLPIEEREIPCTEATEETDPDGDCPDLAPGQREHTVDGHEGYLVEFWRVIERPGREPVRERFYWAYRMFPDTYLVGVGPEPPPTTPPTTGPDPEPTTTTAPPTSAAATTTTTP